MRSLFTATRERFTNYTPAYVDSATRLTLPAGWGGTGAGAQLRAMGASETLYGIVSRTSTSVAGLDWGLWRPSPDGDPDTRKRVMRHAVLDFIARPNPFMAWAEFIEICQQHMDLVGEMWWVLHYGAARGVRMPIEMWPVRPDRMEPVPGRERFIEGYIYSGPNGERVPLTIDEVVFTKSPNPLDIYRGMGPVQTILNRIDAQRFSAEWNANFFKNSAQPGGIIEAPEQVSDAEFQTFRDRWEESHRGTSAAGRVAVIEGGWKWIDRKFSHADMQFTELETAGVEAIMRAFTFSKFDLGMIDDVNRATAEASKAVYGERITVPRANRIKVALQTGILPRFGAQALEIDYDRAQAVPADREADDRERVSQSQAFKTYIDAGVDPAEAAEVCGLPPLKVTKPEPPPAPVMPPGVPAQSGGEVAAMLLANRALDMMRAERDLPRGHGRG